MSDAGDQFFWDRLRLNTRARIGLGRAGNALPTRSLLDFQLACAQAKDAVHGEADFDELEMLLAPLPCLHVGSQAITRGDYLRRPDLGRKLTAESRARLEEGANASGRDIVFIACDGLSASAVMAHAAPVLKACVPRLQGWKVAPIVLARHARVALGDEVAQALGCRMAVVLIGERPGLSSPDSLGIYITWSAVPGTVDARRNCISNVHASGLAPVVAADKAVWLIKEAARLRLSGTGLKEEFPALSESQESRTLIGDHIVDKS